MTLAYTHIIKLLGERDPATLEVLYEQYARKWYGLAVTKWSLDQDAAWEVIYKTLDVLIQKMVKTDFESQAHFDNYLFKVFTNNLRQLYRERSRQHSYYKEVPLFYEPKNQDSHEDLPEGEAINLPDFALPELIADDANEHTLLVQLQDALEQLDESDRDVLLLRAQNFSYEDIARLLQIENNQLKVKYFRAKQRLIKLFNQPKP